jgi:hypothetical protein
MGPVRAEGPRPGGASRSTSSSRPFAAAGGSGGPPRPPARRAAGPSPGGTASWRRPWPTGAPWRQPCCRRRGPRRRERRSAPPPQPASATGRWSGGAAWTAPRRAAPAARAGPDPLRGQELRPGPRDQRPLQPAAPAATPLRAPPDVARGVGVPEHRRVWGDQAWPAEPTGDARDRLPEHSRGHVRIRVPAVEPPQGRVVRHDPGPEQAAGPVGGAERTLGGAAGQARVLPRERAGSGAAARPGARWRPPAARNGAVRCPWRPGGGRHDLSSQTLWQGNPL